MASTESKLSDVIERVFRVTLNADRAGSGDRLHLESLASEMVMEGAEPPFAVTSDNLERVLFARLSTPSDALGSWASDPEAAPFVWLVRSYDRCHQETRKTRSRDEAYAEALTTTLASCFELCVNYSGLLLNPAMAGTFPQPPAAEARGALQLFDAMCADEGLPHGFLDDFAARFAEDGLADVLGPCIAQLPSLIRRVSPLGDYRKPVSLLCALAASKPAAAVLVAHPRWLPPRRSARPPLGSPAPPPDAPNGRAFEDDSILGPFFACGALPDAYPPSLPDVRAECFRGLDRRRPGELESSYSTIRVRVGTLRDGLYQALYAMLRHGGDIREGVVRWFARQCDENAGRSKMQIDPLTCCSHSGATNAAATATRLAAPFADVASRKFTKIDPNYARSRRCRLNLAEVTRVAAGTEAVAEGALTEAEEPAEAYGFICECFFFASRALHLGFIKCVAEHTQLARELQDRQSQMNDVEGMRANWEASLPGGPNAFQRAQFDRRVEELRAELEECKENYACFDAALQDMGALREITQFYRLAAAWLIWVATEGKDASGGSDLARAAAAAAAAGEPAGGELLPPTPSKSWALLPEHIVDDIAEFLLYVCRFVTRNPHHAARDFFGSERLDELASLFVLLLGSPAYVKNPYLRAKFVEVLRNWLPGDPSDPKSGWNPALANLFEGHPLMLAHLVPAALRLYVDIEFTGAANQFYDKFNIRYQIGEICEYLWRVEPHRRAWAALARDDPTFYMRFLNMLINDAIWLLDESMKKLPELREYAAESADAAAWAARPARERAEREAANRQNERALRSDLMLAKVHVGMMGYTSRDIASPFLVPEMVERVAAMLNYFLLYLAGPERKKLKFADRDKMKELNWDPPEMLGMIVDVYLHLFDADKDGAFVAAVVADGRSYRDEVMVETCAILRQLGTRNEADISRFEALTESARMTHAAAEEEEADLGEVPDDFLDPIMCTLMTDPVRLPSGDVMDRANIMRHLLTDETNPFTRQPLKAEDLVPDDALKAQIDGWIAERRGAAAAKRA